jgi:thioredoxin 1
MSNILEVTDSNFESEVIKKSGKILVDFWAPWCKPCKMQTPILEKLSGSDEISVKITKLNTEENPKTAQQFQISSIPTLVIFQDGKEIDRLIGLQTENNLAEKLK